MAGFKPFTPRPQNNAAQGNQNRGRRPVKENPNRINNEITAPTVRVVGDNVEPNLVLPIAKAIALADEMELDLVEISPNAEPPVCRIVDYQKFLYQQKKKQKEIKAKQTKVVIKEIRFGPQTDDHDFNFKLRHAENFIKEGAKVKAYVFFRGRSILFKEQGEVLLLRFANDLEEYGKVESMPSLEGKKMFLYLAPKKAGTAKKSQQAIDREKKSVNNENVKAEIESEDTPSNGGLFANAKISADALKKLTGE